jgi:hypothetical protein
MPFPPPFAEILLARRDPPLGVGPMLASVVGVVGFVGLLIAAAFVGAMRDLLGACALIWFLGLGVVGVVIDLRESRSSVRVIAGPQSGKLAK